MQLPVSPPAACSPSGAWKTMQQCTVNGRATTTPATLNPAGVVSFADQVVDVARNV